MYFLLAKGIFILIALALGVLVYIIVFFRDFVFGSEDTSCVPLENTKKSKRNEEYAIFLARKIRWCKIKVFSKELLDDPETNKIFHGLAILEEKNGISDIFIYDSKGEKIGKISDNSFDLSYSIKHGHEGNIFTWGKLEYDSSSNSVNAYTYIPKGYNKKEIKELERLYFLILRSSKNIKLLSKRPSGIFLYLDNQLNIERIHIALGEPDELYFPFKKSILPSVSKLLEQQQDWDGLIKLEKYSAFINRLSPIYANAIRNRINLAKSMQDKPQFNKKISESKISESNQKLMNIKTGYILEPLEWETPRAYWSNFQKPDYRYSEKKKAWWKQKEGS